MSDDYSEAHARELYLDPAKVILWCEEHRMSTFDLRACDPEGRRHQSSGVQCRIKVATVEIVGDPA